MTSWVLALLLQSSVLVYHDVYTATAPNNEWAKSIDGQDRESNPIAAQFTKAGQYDMLFMSAAALNTGIAIILPESGKQIYLTALSIAEIYAMSQWDQGYTPLRGPMKMKFKTVIYQAAF